MPTKTLRFRQTAFGRNVPFFILALMGLLLAGCIDFGDTLRNRLPVEAAPQVRTFPADPKATFAAARAALDEMGFRFTGGGPAQGRLVGISEVSPGEAQGSSHQFTLRAEFHPTLDGSGTEVSVRMTEVIEADSTHHLGQGTETPLRDTPLADVFYQGIQRNLGSRTK